MYRTLSALVIAAFLTDTALGGIVTIFTDKDAFEAFNLSEGKFVKGVEDFEESNLAGLATAVVIDDPLQGNVANVNPNGLGFPNGLTEKNIIIQSNTLGFNAPQLSPRGLDGLTVSGPQGPLNSVLVGPLMFEDSLDLIFTEPNHTGIGFDVVDFFANAFPGGSIHITVFNKSNQEIAKEIVPAQVDKVFFGIWSDETIGRINIASDLPGLEGGSEFVDNIQMWTSPPPGPDLDIKPGSCPNSYNRNSNGVLPVALVGTPGFNVKEVDLNGILLVRKDGQGGSVAPLDGPPGPGSSFEDVATPFVGEEQCDCADLGGDGIQDLSMKFKTDDVVAQLQLNDCPDGALVSLTVIGSLFDGTLFSADDCVRLVPPGTPPGLLAVDSNVAGVFIDAAPLDNQLDGGGFPDFARTYPAGTVVTLTAPPTHEGSIFVGWLINGVYDPTAGNPLDITIEGGLLSISHQVPQLEWVVALYRRPLIGQPSGSPPKRRR